MYVLLWLVRDQLETWGHAMAASPGTTKAKDHTFIASRNDLKSEVVRQVAEEEYDVDLAFRVICQGFLVILIVCICAVAEAQQG